MQQSPITPSELYGRQILRRIVPILVTCYLVYWLSGGIPPTSWEQLVQVCIHFTTLLASKGTGALVTLLVLFAQALCIGFAWGFLLWLMVREFQALRAGMSPQSNIAGQRSASFTQSPQALHPSSPPHVSGQMGASYVQPYQTPSLEQPASVGIGHWQAPPMQTSSVLFDNPFADETQNFPLIAQSDQVRASYVSTTQKSYTPDSKKQTILFDDPFSPPFDKDNGRQQGQHIPSRAQPSEQGSSHLSALPIPLPVDSARPSVQLSDVSTPFDAQESGELERLESIAPGSDEIHYSDMLGTLGFIPTRVQPSGNEEKKIGKPVEPIQREAEPPIQSQRPASQAQKEQAVTRIPLASEKHVQAAVPPISVAPPAPPAPTPSNNPFDVQADIFDLFSFGATPIEPVMQPVEQQRITPVPDSTLPFAGSAGNNPFEELALPESQSASTSLVRASQTSMAQPEPTEVEEEDEEDDPFIFGNPFEGPLPDVFHQDSDLRQSILEHTGDVIEAPIEQTRAKKKRPKKRSTPTQQP